MTACHGWRPLVLYIQTDNNKSQERILQTIKRTNHRMKHMARNYPQNHYFGDFLREPRLFYFLARKAAKL